MRRQDRYGWVGLPVRSAARRVRRDRAHRADGNRPPRHHPGVGGGAPGTLGGAGRGARRRAVRRDLLPRRRPCLGRRERVVPCGGPEVRGCATPGAPGVAGGAVREPGPSVEGSWRGAGAPGSWRQPARSADVSLENLGWRDRRGAVWWQYHRGRSSVRSPAKRSPGSAPGEVVATWRGVVGAAGVTAGASTARAGATAGADVCRAPRFGPTMGLLRWRCRGRGARRPERLLHSGTTGASTARKRPRIRRGRRAGHDDLALDSELLRGPGTRTFAMLSSLRSGTTWA